jgi:hypothetical protein
MRKVIVTVCAHWIDDIMEAPDKWGAKLPKKTKIRYSITPI